MVPDGSNSIMLVMEIFEVSLNLVYKPTSKASFIFSGVMLTTKCTLVSVWCSL